MERPRLQEKQSGAKGGTPYRRSGVDGPPTGGVERSGGTADRRSGEERREEKPTGGVEWSNSRQEEWSGANVSKSDCNPFKEDAYNLPPYPPLMSSRFLVNMRGPFSFLHPPLRGPSNLIHPRGSLSYLHPPFILTCNTHSEIPSTADLFHRFALQLLHMFWLSIRGTISMAQLPMQL